MLECLDMIFFRVNKMVFTIFAYYICEFLGCGYAMVRRSSPRYISFSIYFIAICIYVYYVLNINDVM